MSIDVERNTYYGEYCLQIYVYYRQDIRRDSGRPRLQRANHAGKHEYNKAANQQKNLEETNKKVLLRSLNQKAYLQLEIVILYVYFIVIFLYECYEVILK